MKLKEGVSKQGTDDFWYDLTFGGYINPEDLLDSQDDIERVTEAIEILKEFERIATEEM